MLARRGEVWFSNIPALWKFTGRYRAETRTELLRGFGLRFNFTGHDFHGLIFGPDGRLYMSIGDRAASVPTKEGTVVDAPDTQVALVWRTTTPEVEECIGIVRGRTANSSRGEPTPKTPKPPRAPRAVTPKKRPRRR